uniref:Uncharacterized protein n=1 Tax=Biomphalaria glabrata TaxID=6526 RepID=A0A2C9K4P5_BIOGL
MYWLLQVSVLYLYLPVCLAFFAYKDKLPNSDNVQHPCVAVYKWPGVGHEHRLGGGNRNVFGQDFAKAGHKWTKALCTADSDGDGRTNGEELGDPSCVWSVGQEPSRTVNITHPGICEPLHDVTCHGKNNFVSCEVDTFDTCDVIKSPDIKTLDLVMPNLIIPPTVTNDLCLTFDLPDDQDYHMVAYEAIIDTPNIVHHMDMYGCEKDENFILESPKPCDMSMKACSTEINGWMIGMSGQCYGDNLAYSIGKSGYKRFRLEIHYHNPNLEHGHQDSSGMRIYYRPARPGVQELFTLPVGQLFLELPPGQSRVERTGVLTESCTAQMFKEPVYVIFGYNHMHLTGLYTLGFIAKDL